MRPPSSYSHGPDKTSPNRLPPDSWPERSCLLAGAGVCADWGRHALFNDPGTLWHLRLGRDIVASGSVPRCDTLTFTRAKSPWVDQSWGFDALLALVVDHWGWSAAVGLTVLVLASVYAALAGGLVRDGISPVVAVVVALLMAAIGCVHFLIRPHIFTFAFVYLTLRVCQLQHQRGGLIVVWVPVLTAILANLHGGFLALPVIAASAGVGHAISGHWDQARQQNVVRFSLASLASCLAALEPLWLGTLPTCRQPAHLQRRDEPYQ